MRWKFRNIIQGLPLVVSAVLAGCINSYDECPPTGGDVVDQLSLSIKMYVPDMGTGTRTESTTDEPHKQEDGSKPDNYINVSANDYSIFILDNAGGDDCVMQRFEPSDIMRISGSDNVYALTGNFKPEGMKNIRIMVMANWRDFKRADDSDVYGSGVSFGATRLNDLYSDNTKYNYSYPASDAQNTWTPTAGTDGRGIPMFGVSEPTDISGFRYSGPDNRIDVEPILMLRSLAKIEVIDKIPENENVTINDCRLTWYNTKGRFVPNGINNPEWNVEAKQVSSPSLPDGDLKSSVKLNFLRTDEYGEANSSGKTFIAYVPEMDLRNLTEENRPIIEVELNVNGVTQEKQYPIKFARYNADCRPDVNYDYILRNHLYRFNVLSAGVDMDLTLVIETPFWDLQEDQTWTYEDAKATFEKDFEWRRPVYDDSDILDDPDRILLVTDETGAEGTFTLSGPKDGTWTLSLFADDDTRNDHFRIDIMENGEWVPYSDTVTKSIDGKEVEFRIIATAPNSTSTDYTARVVMTVKTFDDRMANVKLTTNDEGNPEEDRFYYVVKQLTNGGDNM